MAAFDRKAAARPAHWFVFRVPVVVRFWPFAAVLARFVGVRF